MKKIAAAALSLIFATTAMANTTKNTFTPTQTQAIESIVHEYLVAHPVVLVEAAQALQKQQQINMQSQAQQGISQNAKALFNNPVTPVLGNQKGNVTIVEFFDYQCSVCQRMAPVVENLMKNNANVRFVMKEWPIFGAASEYAARAALAANEQGKFQALYETLMKNTESSEGKLTQEEVDEMAKASGVDVDKMHEAMKNKAYVKELADNLHQAEAMRLVGTPAFLIAKTPNGVYSNAKVFFVPGGASEATLQQFIHDAS